MYICVYQYTFIYTPRAFHSHTHTHMHTTYTRTHTHAVHEYICVYQYVHMGGWLRSVGSIKLQVSFAGYRLFYRALLQKRPII